MKNLMLVRHAKSSWARPELQDIDRPLNSRGQRDGPFMAKYCREMGLVPDVIMSSPAKRAQLTAAYFNQEFKKEIKAYYTESELYFGSEEDWLSLIENLEESTDFPAFFSHNPTITYFANRFKGPELDNVPTCGVIHLISTVDLWKDIHYSNTRIQNHYFPKLVRNI